MIGIRRSVGIASITRCDGEAALQPRRWLACGQQAGQPGVALQSGCQPRPMNVGGLSGAGLGTAYLPKPTCSTPCIFEHGKLIATALCVDTKPPLKHDEGGNL